MRKPPEVPPEPPPPPRPELEIISFRCEPDVRVKLDRLVVLTGLSQSELLRRLIESATAQSPRVEAHLASVVSRQRYSKAGTRKIAIGITARANGTDEENETAD